MFSVQQLCCGNSARLCRNRSAIFLPRSSRATWLAQSSWKSSASTNSATAVGVIIRPGSRGTDSDIGKGKPASSPRIWTWKWHPGEFESPISIFHMAISVGVESFEDSKQKRRTRVDATPASSNSLQRPAFGGTRLMSHLAVISAKILCCP